MRRYLRIYRSFWETSFAREAEFRANFWSNVVTNAGWLFFFVAFIKVVYLNTPRIGNWSEPEALVLTGTFGLLQGLFGVFFYMNLAKFPELVRMGTFDFYVTKPVDSQFFVSTRYLKLDSLGNLLGAVVVILYGASLAKVQLNPAALGGYLYLLLCGLLLYYSVYLLVMTLSFWLVRVENLAVLSDMLFHMGRYPVDVFHPSVRAVFTWVLPLAFVGSFPARALFGKLEPHWYAVATSLALGLFCLSAAFWKHGVRSYSSASS